MPHNGRTDINSYMGYATVRYKELGSTHVIMVKVFGVLMTDTSKKSGIMRIQNILMFPVYVDIKAHLKHTDVSCVC